MRNITLPGLAVQLSQVEQLVGKMMCVNSQENLINGINTKFDLEVLDLKKDEMRSIIQVICHPVTLLH